MLNLNKQFWHDRCLCLIIKILSAAELQQMKDNHVTAKSLRGLHCKEEVSGWRLKGLLGCACIFSIGASSKVDGQVERSAPRKKRHPGCPIFYKPGGFEVTLGINDNENSCGRL